MVRLSLQNSVEQKDTSQWRCVRTDTAGLSAILAPVCEVVVSVGHVDQTLDEVGFLYETKKDLQITTIRGRDHRRCVQVGGQTSTSVSRGMWSPFPCSTVDLRDLPCHARLRWPSARPDQEKTS